MKKKDGNVVHSFPDIWETFLAFESVSRSQGESLDDFLGRWQENMCSAQSTGCDFSDTFLVCKLLQKANLDQFVLKKIVNSLAYTKSELLYQLLSKLGDILGDKSQRDEAQITDHAEPIGEELAKEATSTSKRIKLSEEDLLMSVQVKLETFEAPKPPAQSGFSNLLDKMQDVADNIEDAGSFSQNNSQGNKCLEMDPLDTEGDHVPDVPENILTDSEQEDNEMPAEKRWEKNHLANKKDFPDNSMVDEDMEDEHSSSLQPVEKILEELEFDVKEEGFDEFPLLASIHSNQPIQQIHAKNQQSYNCYQCSYKAEDEKQLILHMFILHRGQQPFKCLICMKTFASKESTNKHMVFSHAYEEMKRHTNGQTYKGTLSSHEADDDQKLNPHMLTTLYEQPFKCLFCETTFASEELMNSHIKVSHSDNVPQLDINGPPYQCSHCDLITQYKSSIIAHIRTHTGERPFKCPACPKSFTTKARMKTHHRRAHSNGQSNKGTPSSNGGDDGQKLTRLMSTYSDERPFKCSFCEITFASEELMKNHIKISHSDNVQQLHISGPPYQCPNCDFIATCKDIIKAHIRTHTGERPFKCADCPKCFTTKAKMKIHQRRWHTNERNFKCTLCNFAAVEKNDLTIHMYKHTEERPFECTFCSKAFKCEKFLKTHIKRSHAGKELPTRNIKPLYKCSQCNFKATEKMELTQHSLVHVDDQPWKCLSCDLTFKSEDLMNRHIKVSHIDKEQNRNLTISRPPYHCSYCYFVTKYKTGIVAHIQTHTGEKSLMARDCRKGFTTKSKIKTHHKEKRGNETSSDIEDENVPKNVENSQCEFCGVYRKNMKKHHASCHGMSEDGPRQVPEKKLGLKDGTRKVSEKKQCEYCGNYYASHGGLRSHYSVCPNIDEEERKAKGYKDMKVKCELCGKMVKNTYYRHHISLHSDKRDYKCDICPSSFTSSLFLSCHKKRHENQFPYKCDICPRAFTNSNGLKEHKRREHTNERPFQCDQCSYSSVAKGHLIRHLRTHTGERPFKCPVCEKSFSEKKDVKRHIKNVHLRGDDKGEVSAYLGIALGNERIRMASSI